MSISCKEMITGIPWYRREQWSRWKEVSDDREEMCDSYDEWLEGAEALIKKLTREHVEVHKVDVELGEFLEWAAGGELRVSGFTRADFANVKLGREHLRRRSMLNEPIPSKNELKGAMGKAKGMDSSEICEPYLRRPKAAICPYFAKLVTARSRLDQAFS